MKTELHTGVTGTFYFKDPSTGEIIHEIKNKITDIGMQRLAGHISHDLWSLSENWYHLFFGTSNAGTGPSTIGLVQPYYDRSYTAPLRNGDFDVVHNPSKTKTEFYFDAAGNLIIDFYQAFEVKFFSLTEIKEIGVGPASLATKNYNDLPQTTFKGTRYTPQGLLGGGTTRVHQYYPGTTTVDINNRNDIDSHPNRQIWSRAIVPATSPVIYQPDDVADVIYRCTLQVCKEISNLSYDLELDLSSMVVPNSAVNQLPKNKTGLMTFPYYPLNGERTSTRKFQGLIAAPALWSSMLSNWTYYSPTKHEVPPLFENLPYDQAYVVAGPTTPAASNPSKGGVWLLDFYSQSNALQQIVDYGTFTSTITSVNLIDTSGTSTPLPIKADRIHSTIGTPTYSPTTTFIARTPLPTVGVPATIDYFNQISDRTPADIVYTQAGSTWTTTVRFLVNTKELNANGVNLFSLWRAPNPNYEMPVGIRPYGGLTTTLSATWTPETNKVLGLDFELSFTRL